MSVLSLLQLGAAAISAKATSEDVYSAYQYTGTGAALTLTDNINRTQGAVDIFKASGTATDWAWYDTARGVQNDLTTTSTAAQTTQAQGVTATSSNSVTIGTLAKLNTSAAAYEKITFRNAPKFFTHLTVSHTNGAADTVDLSTLGTVGMVTVKRATGGIGSWFTWVSSLSAGKLLYLNDSTLQTTDSSISVSGTNLTISASLPTGTYVVYAWAHNTASDGMIRFGTFTTNSSGNNLSVINLGWEVQALWIKSLDVVGSWYLIDIYRGMSLTDGRALPLQSASTSSQLGNASFPICPTAVGVNISAGWFSASNNYMYMAIRRGPMRNPTVGTQVFNAIARTGTGAAAAVTGVGFPPDLVIGKDRGTTATWTWNDRLRGVTQELTSAAVTAESAFANDLTVYGSDGFSVGTGASGQMNTNTNTYILECLRRYPGVFDQICYTGTGANKTETIPLLGVAPSLWIVKARNGATQWVIGSSLLANTEKIVSPSPNGKVTDATAWNSTYPTATALSLGSASTVNASATTFVAWLFASLTGISKVGTYTGDGTTGQTINCGFSAGVRFIMIIRTTAATAQDIFIWDSVRGIVAGNDGHLSLSTTAAEVTTDDSIDPDNSGFIVNQLAATNINVNGANYIYLAIA